MLLKPDAELVRKACDLNVTDSLGGMSPGFMASGLNCLVIEIGRPSIVAVRTAANLVASAYNKQSVGVYGNMRKG